MGGFSSQVQTPQTSQPQGGGKMGGMASQVAAPQPDNQQQQVMWDHPWVNPQAQTLPARQTLPASPPPNNNMQDLYDHPRIAEEYDGPPKDMGGVSQEYDNVQNAVTDIHQPLPANPSFNPSFGWGNNQQQYQPRPMGKGGMQTNSATSGQPRMGQQNQYSNTVGQWDNTQIQPVSHGKGKGG